MSELDRDSVWSDCRAEGGSRRSCTNGRDLGLHGGIPTARRSDCWRAPGMSLNQSQNEFPGEPMHVYVCLRSGLNQQSEHKYSAAAIV